MTPIIFPLKPRQRSDAVANLQDSLQELLGRAVVLADDEAGRRELAAALEGERAKTTYGSATRKLVRAFQAAHGLEAHGEIDEATANALNELLQPSEELPSIFRSPLYEGAEGPGVALVQEILVGLGLFVAAHEFEEHRFGKSTLEAVSSWQRQCGLPSTGVLDLEVLKRLFVQGRDVPRVVHGVVRLDDGTPVPGLRVVAIDRDFRAEQTLGDASTDDSGRYRIVYRSRAFAQDVMLVHQILTSLGLFVRAAE